MALASGSRSATQAPASHCGGRPHTTFRAADGTRLVGASFGRGEVAVVLAHQYRGNLCQWATYARRLASRGYVAFAFDFRSNGLSQQVGYRRSGRLAGDVSAAVKLVRSRGATKVFVVGASMGAAAVVAAGGNTRPPVAGVVSLSAPASFGGADAARAAPRLRVPVLYLASADDAGGAFARDARTLYDATPSPDKALEILPGSTHGVGLVAFPGRGRALVEAFLRSH